MLHHARPPTRPHAPLHRCRYIIQKDCKHAQVALEGAVLGATTRGSGSPTQAAGRRGGQGGDHASALAAQEAVAGARRPHRHTLPAVVLSGVTGALERHGVVGV